MGWPALGLGVRARAPGTRLAEVGALAVKERSFYVLILSA